MSVQGAGGFKKSFRDERLATEVALIDPDLLASCPPAVVAANGTPSRSCWSPLSPATPLGAFFPIPHSVACGTLVAMAMRINIEAMRTREPTHQALEKYAQVGRLLGKRGHLDQSDAHAVLLLMDHPA